jgi:uncharacterized protein (DUF1778 family)
MSKTRKGRPPKPPNPETAKRFAFLCSEEIRGLITRAAKIAKRSESDWVRSAVEAAARKQLGE